MTLQQATRGLSSSSTSPSETLPPAVSRWVSLKHFPFPPSILNEVWAGSRLMRLIFRVVWWHYPQVCITLQIKQKWKGGRGGGARELIIVSVWHRRTAENFRQLCTGEHRYVLSSQFDPFCPKQMRKGEEEEEVVLADCLSLESTLCLKAIRRLLSTGTITRILKPHFLSRWHLAIECTLLL